MLLRAAVGEHARLERVRLVGDDGAGKFGMDGADLAAAAAHAVASPHLDLLGVHAFGASNVLDASALVEHVGRHRPPRAAPGDARRERASASSTPAAVSGSRTSRTKNRSTSSGSVVGWRPSPRTGRQTRSCADARLLLEPGRFLVGPAGAYLARVVDRKTVGGSVVAILDGGVHHLLRPALVGQEHRIRAFGRGAGNAGSGGGRMVPVTVAGPLCSGLDVFSQGAVMAPPEVGDLVAVLDVGAYGFTESMPFFLSHPIPAEVAVRDGQAALIRPRQDPGEWLERQVLPAW